MLPKKYRLTKDKDFVNVRKNGRRAHSKYFVLTWVSNQLNSSRFGIIASKKVGNAVQRHRAARLLRESLRHHLDDVGLGYDFVIIARAGIVNQKQPAVEEELLNLLTKHDLIQ